MTGSGANAAALRELALEFFDGMSIGSNDMTQLTLGLDRDSAIVASGFDERDEAVRQLLALSIAAARSPSPKSARRLFLASLVYLPLLLAALVADRLV